MVIGTSLGFGSTLVPLQGQTFPSKIVNRTQQVDNGLGESPGFQSFRPKFWQVRASLVCFVNI